MNAPTEFQTIFNTDGTPAFVVVPYPEFRRMTGGSTGTIPNEVVNATFDKDISPVRAWREHLMLTQDVVAERMGITQGAFAQMEAAKRPRKATLEKIARAMGLSLEQLAW
jgi:DNA-binding XRE family transcriptional regulator